MIAIYRIDHLSQVVADIRPQARLLEGLFGYRQVEEWEDGASGCRGALFELPSRREARWELLEPASGDSPLVEFLDGPSGPGIHHVAVETNDLDAARRELEAPGARRDGPGDAWIDSPMGSPAGALLFRLFGPPVRYGSAGVVRPAPARDDGERSEAGDGADAERGPREERDAPAREAGTLDLGITGLVHVCQVTRDLDAFAARCERLLGMRPIYRTPEGKHPDMATMMLTVPGTPIIWELIAPEGEDSFVERFLEKRGEGACHHLTFEVEDWEQALEACRRAEVPTFGESRGETDGARWRDAFIHPKHTGGVLVQLCHEERPGVWMRSDKVAAAGTSWT